MVMEKNRAVWQHILEIPPCLGLPESLDVGVKDQEGIENDS